VACIKPQETGKRPRVPTRRAVLTKSDETVYKECLLMDEKEFFVYFPKTMMEDETVQKTRREILKWIYHYGNKFDQSEVTIQVAMVYVDKLIFLEKIKELEKNLIIWAGTALLVASKFSELDYKLLRICDLTGKVFCSLGLR
jgi:hypothetical protein